MGHAAPSRAPALSWRPVPSGTCRAIFCVYAAGCLKFPTQPAHAPGDPARCGVRPAASAPARHLNKKLDRFPRGSDRRGHRERCMRETRQLEGPGREDGMALGSKRRDGGGVATTSLDDNLTTRCHERIVPAASSCLLQQPTPRSRLRLRLRLQLQHTGHRGAGPGAGGAVAGAVAGAMVAWPQLELLPAPRWCQPTICSTESTPGASATLSFSVFARRQITWRAVVDAPHF